jgi:hypothetical protein
VGIDLPIRGRTIHTYYSIWNIGMEESWNGEERLRRQNSGDKR